MLEHLFNKYGCDKSSKHRYHLVYENTFNLLKNKEINLLEIGIYKGGSLEAYCDYFERARIYAIDDFSRIPPSKVGVLNRERVHWLKGDSTKKEIVRSVIETFGDRKYDIVIDDGAHCPEANQLSYRNFIGLLEIGGVYFIEDVWPIDIMTEKERAHPWLCKHEAEFTQEAYRRFLDEIDGDGYEVTKYDLRRLTGEPDSYIIRVDKCV